MVNIADVKILTMKKAMIWTSMLLILSGCHMADGFQDEQEVSENVYKAVMEGFSPDTKTELDANKILWSSGDRITVLMAMIPESLIFSILLLQDLHPENLQ